MVEFLQQLAIYIFNQQNGQINLEQTEHIPKQTVFIVINPN